MYLLPLQPQQKFSQHIIVPTEPKKINITRRRKLGHRGLQCSFDGGCEFHRSRLKIGRGLKIDFHLSIHLLRNQSTRDHKTQEKHIQLKEKKEKKNHKSIKRHHILTSDSKSK